MNDLEKKLDKVHEKLDAIDAKIGNVDMTLVEQAGQLKHHIYRTDLNEQHLKMLQAQVDPISDFMAKFNGIMKFIGVIVTGLTFVVGLIKLFKELL